MNHTYRLLWSHARRAWVVVGETAHSQSKNTTRGVVLAAASLAVTVMLASPLKQAPVAGKSLLAKGLSTTVQIPLPSTKVATTYLLTGKVLTSVPIKWLTLFSPAPQQQLLTAF